MKGDLWCGVKKKKKKDQKTLIRQPRVLSTQDGKCESRFLPHVDLMDEQNWHLIIYFYVFTFNSSSKRRHTMCTVIQKNKELSAEDKECMTGKFVWYWLFMCFLVFEYPLLKRFLTFSNFVFKTALAVAFVVQIPSLAWECHTLCLMFRLTANEPFLSHYHQLPNCLLIVKPVDVSSKQRPTWQCTIAKYLGHMYMFPIITSLVYHIHEA